MKILVTAKRVPNPEQKLKFGGGQIDLSAASWQAGRGTPGPSIRRSTESRNSGAGGTNEAIESTRSELSRHRSRSARSTVGRFRERSSCR